MKIGVIIPTYNEEGNVECIYQRLTDLFKNELAEYDYEILYIDNRSTDRTRTILQDLCRRDERVKCIFNINNFGYYHSSFYGFIQSDGDATFMVNADMQDPPEMLVKFVEEWEKGAPVVIGVKEGSKDPFWIQCFRKAYYWLVGLLSARKQIAHFNGFGLYDKSFVEIMRSLDEREPYMKDLVAEYSPSLKILTYKQNKRTSGKGTTNFFELYDCAMVGITSTSKIVLRSCTFVGFALSLVSLALAISAFISKLLHWNDFQLGISGLVVGMFFLGSVQLLFLGIIGEYILAINAKAMHRPLVVEERRINFRKNNKTKDEVTPEDKCTTIDMEDV